MLECQTEELRKSEEANEKLQTSYKATQIDLEGSRRETAQIKNVVRALLASQQVFNKNLSQPEEGNEVGDNQSKAPHHKFPIFSPDRDESALELVETLRHQLDVSTELMTSFVEQKQDLVTSLNRKMEEKSAEVRERTAKHEELKEKLEKAVRDCDDTKAKLAASEANCDETAWKLNEAVAKHEEELEVCRKEAEVKINGACDELECVRDKIQSEKEDIKHEMEKYKDLSMKAESELKEASEENKKLQDLNKKDKVEIERLAENLRAADEKLREARKKRGKSDKVADELKSHLAVSTAEIASLQSRVQQKVQAHSMVFCFSTRYNYLYAILCFLC